MFSIVTTSVGFTQLCGFSVRFIALRVIQSKRGFTSLCVC